MLNMDIKTNLQYNITHIMFKVSWDAMQIFFINNVGRSSGTFLPPQHLCLNICTIKLMYVGSHPLCKKITHTKSWGETFPCLSIQVQPHATIYASLPHAKLPQLQQCYLSFPEDFSPYTHFYHAKLLSSAAEKNSYIVVYYYYSTYFRL